MERLACLSVLVLLSGACSNGGTPADSGNTDVGTTDASDAIVGSDVVVDTVNPLAGLSYQPTGCAYTVTTTTGTYGNVMSMDTVFGANPTPTNVHINWASDPSSTAAFLWATDSATLASVVEYGTAPGTLDHSQRGHRTIAGGGANAADVHEVHVCGLTPDTTYYYHVGGPGNFSPTYQFKTAPAPGGSGYDVNFVVSGDSRQDLEGDPSNFPRDWTSVQAQIAQGAATAQPDFQLFTGDAVFTSTDQPSWNQWFQAAVSNFAGMPWVMVQGNHEALSANYLAQIAQPQATGELYFSFDYGPIHFVVLNDTPPPDMLDAITGVYATWLTQDLAAVDRARTPWIVATNHKGPYTTSAHSTDADVGVVRTAWTPIFEQYNVDLVLSGHDHTLHITHPLRAGAVAATGGTVYIVTGGAGAPLYTVADPAPAIYQYVASELNFLRVHATEHTIDVSAMGSDGVPIPAAHVVLSRP